MILDEMVYMKFKNVPIYRCVSNYAINTKKETMINYSCNKDNEHKIGLININMPMEHINNESLFKYVNKRLQHFPFNGLNSQMIKKLN